MTEHLKEIAAQLTKDLNLDLRPAQFSYWTLRPPVSPGGPVSRVL